MDSTSVASPTILSSPSASRRRKYENETPSQRTKREKAAERQRRKRERDRHAINALNPQVNPNDSQDKLEQLDHNPSLSSSSQVHQSNEYVEDLTPEEAARRERVRAAARERQRKHRALVKQKKLRELGVDMGNQVVPTLSEMGYTDQPFGLPPSEMSVQMETHAVESVLPRIQGHGGQMFATTMLLSFSCAPLLKQHLMESLQMSNEELASFEPILAEAWDNWDRQRRQQYDPQFEQQNATSSASSSTTTTSSATASGTSISTSTPNIPQPSPSDAAAAIAAAAIANTTVGAPPTPDFRARFHRSILGPSPFQAQAAAVAAQIAAATVVANAATQVMVEDDTKEEE